MFDDLIDRDPPRPGLDVLANVSERARRLRRRRDATRVLGLGAVAALLGAGLALVAGGSLDEATPTQPLDSLPSAVVDLGTLTSTAATTDVPTTPPGTTAVDSTITLPVKPIPFLAIGDSVMLGAAPALHERGLVIDAAVNRQMIDLIPLFEQFRDRGLFGTAVVVHLGTNGPISQDTLDAFLATMDQVPNVILMTIKADRTWTAENNALIRAADHEGDNKILIDWELLSTDCPGQCFYEDGIHMRQDGQQYYADLISDVLGI